MFCEVTTLRRDGERLRPEQWPAAEFGHISMEVWRPEENRALSRVVNVATLRQKVGSLERVAVVLIEPKVTHTPFDDMVWAGTELKQIGDAVTEVEQAWLVRPRAQGAPPLPPFDWKGWMATRTRRDQR